VSLTVRPISREEHLALVSRRGHASFLQCPSWGDVKRDWRSESIGWFDPDGKVVGAGLVLYRQVPRMRRYFAYLPEGPLLDWAAATDLTELRGLLDPMIAHLRSRRAFAVRMGPPVVVRRWSAETVKAAVAQGAATRLRDLTPDTTSNDAVRMVDMLRTLGWAPTAGAEGFTAGQPQFVFQVPLAGRSVEEIFAGFNQLWRRNVRKAEKSGVSVELGTPGDLDEFHKLYEVTAARDKFTPRPRSYFSTMMEALTAEDRDRFRLYLARHEGDLLAATIWIRVGSHCWYSYGASADHKRDLKPSNAIQWRMLTDAHAAGAAVYDLRGITETLDPNDHLFGLIQFKLGTGGEAVEYLGEWDFPLNPMLHKAFQLYLARRG
jgi:lipid II:glycine glycyltransferase (peptidoglycan interpeptide bridge formation enzyme)